nr:PQQ-binding-like beta-propeller repeat protein [Candidatus Cloacimonadota bacterium]
MKKKSFIWLILFVLTILILNFANIPKNLQAENNEERLTRDREWTIVATYPIPEGASGLAYDGTYLYCGIYGANGDEVYRIDPNTGDYELLFSGPQEDAFGLTYDGSYLWTTDHPGSSSTPAMAMQIDWDGSLISQFNLPVHYMSGIAYDNGDFWVSAYYDPDGEIYKVDNGGNIITQFPAPNNQPWDLCIENDNLWMADYWGDALYMIDPNTGTLIESHNSEHSDPAGIVFDGTYLWYCDNGVGYDQDWLYKIDLGGGGTPEIYIDPTEVDYGIVTVGEMVFGGFVIYNFGTVELIVEFGDITGPGSEFVFWGTGTILFIFPGVPVYCDIPYLPQEPGILDAIGTILSNDPLNPEVEITFTGIAVNPGPDIYVPETSHDYGLVRVNAYTRWFMEIQNIGDDILIIDDIFSDDPHFIVDELVTFPFNIDILNTVQIGIWFHPEAGVEYSATLSISSNDPDQDPFDVSVQGTGVDEEYPIGQTLWHYQISTSWDNSPKAITPISDITGDGVDDVIVCSEDDYIRCFNGNSSGYADILWEKEIYSGSIWQQNELTTTEDINDDGYRDVVVGTPWGDRSIHLLSGKTGETIWTHDTHEYGNGGWVYQVDCSNDYNEDDVIDVLAATGGDAERVYCLNGLTGISIWECPVGGPAFSVIGIEDVTGDGKTDVIAGASNEWETIGYAYCINGETGGITWAFIAAGSSVWALAQIDDITGDGIKDIIIGDFSGNIYGLDATTGGQIYSNSLSPAIITRFEKINDVNGDGHPDIVPAHSTTNIVKVIDGYTVDFIWSHPVADQPWNVARIADISGDGIDDVLVGTLFNNNYCYFLNGVDGSELESINFGTPVDAIAAIPDIVGDGSMEMVAGGRDGAVYCYSGGLDAYVGEVYDISGYIGYFSDDDPIHNAEVNLTGDDIYSTSTNVNGLYFFEEIPEGNYISTPSKADDLGGLSGLDASRIARHAAGLYSFDCLETIAADVSMNGYISGMDASRVARYIAGLITELNSNDINWVFTPEPIPECEDWPPIVYENTREYSPLNSDLTDEDFIGIRLGDVSGNWSPDSRVTLSSESFEAIEFDTNINSILKIPIITEDVTEIEGIDIGIAFNPE